VEPPTASPAAAAGPVTTITPVTLATTTEDADIYYTLNGDTPDSTKTKYEGPITLAVGDPVTLKAVAVKDGWTDSDVLTETYTVTLPQAAKPTAAPAGSTVSAGAAVTLATTTVGADIYYTLDGATTPGAGTGTKYAGPFTLSGTVNDTVTLKAVAVKDGYTASEALTVTYTLTDTPALTPDIAFYNAGYSSGTKFVDAEWTGQGTADEAWTLILEDVAEEQNAVYFAVYKTMAQTITVGNVAGRTDAARVHQAAVEDTVLEAVTTGDGSLTASDTLAVFTVDTADLVFDGGLLGFDANGDPILKHRVFTLEVSDSGGALPKTVTVTLKVTPILTGAAAFKVNWPTAPATPYEPLDLAALTTAGGFTLTRIGPADPNTGTPGAFDGVQAAIEYVDRNAVADTDYLIRVERDHDGVDAPLLPRFYLIFFNNEKNEFQDNVTLRLRGYGRERVLKNNDTVSSKSYNVTRIGTDPAAIGGNSRHGGFFNIGISSIDYTCKKTFILENNITVKGIGGSTESESYLPLIKVAHNAMLVMKKGSKLTEFVGTVGNSTRYPIIIDTNNNATTMRHGYVRIDGGSITNCQFIGMGLLWIDAVGPRIRDNMFHMEPSTDDNPIVFENNSNNLFIIKDTTNDPNRYQYDLFQYRTTGITFPYDGNKYPE
jgi:hypothetical protein